jgi:hypothetical protein
MMTRMEQSKCVRTCRNLGGWNARNWVDGMKLGGSNTPNWVDSEQQFQWQPFHLTGSLMEDCGTVGAWKTAWWHVGHEHVMSSYNVPWNIPNDRGT